MLLLKETMPCLVLVTTKMIFTNKKTSRKYHIFKQSKFFSSVLVRSTVRYGSVRFCIFFHGSVRFGGSVKFLVRSNTKLGAKFKKIIKKKMIRLFCLIFKLQWIRLQKFFNVDPKKL